MTDRSLGAIALVAVCAAAPSRAQQLPAGATVTSVALTGLAQFDTQLGEGGTFGWSGVLATAGVLHQFSPKFGAGISARYDYQQWRFSDPAAFDGTAPWKDLNLPQVSMTFTYAASPTWSFLLIPSVEWAYESGASTGNALDYGAVLMASKVFKPTLVLGLGTAVFHQIYQTKVYPFPVIYWRISDKWKVTNPFQAGPAGGAGVEATYAMSPAWEAGAGGSYRSFVFRLEGEDIGQNRFIPLFLRLGRKLGAQGRVDLYGAGLTNGKLTLRNSTGGELIVDTYAIAPTIALTLQARF